LFFFGQGFFFFFSVNLVLNYIGLIDHFFLPKLWAYFPFSFPLVAGLIFQFLIWCLKAEN